MAAFWNMLREEVLGTVDDFRQKGAIGALRDAALDTKDLALDAGGWLVDGVKGIVTNDDQNMSQAYVVGPEVPKRGSTCMLHLPNGSLVEATAVDVDGVSEPPRARVTAPGIDEPLLVPILAPPAEGETQEAPSTTGANTISSAGMNVIQGFRQEISNTVQEFREKGAVGAMKDAALDAVDIVGSTAKTAVSSAYSLAEPVAQDFREKGAVGAVKDAALDAADILSSTARTAASGAQSLATPLIDLLSDEPEPAGQQASGGQGVAPNERSAGDVEGANENTTLLGGLRQEWRNTVQDFREKGAVGAVKDAALDAVDLVGSTASTALGAANTVTTTAIGAASTAIEGARVRAGPLLEQAGGAASTAIEGARVRAGPLLEQVSGTLPDLWAGASASASSSQPATEGTAPSRTEAAGGTEPAPAAAGGAEPAPAAQKPAAFAPPARTAAAGADSSAAPQAPVSAPAPEASASPRSGSASPPVFSGSSPAAPGAAAPKAKEPVPESSMPAGSAGRKSLVSMRRNMFEKPKPQEESKNESEELID